MALIKPEPCYEDKDGHWVPVPRPVPLADLYRAALLNALAYTSGCQKEAARLLGITPRVMNYKLAQLGLRDKDTQ